MRVLDLLAMAATATLIAWCTFDLVARASDPYDISSRRPAVQSGTTQTKHHSPGTLIQVPGTFSSNAFPAISSAGQSTQEATNDLASSPGISSIATRNQKKEVSPAPGGIERAASQPPVQTAREKRDGHSRAKTHYTKAELAAEVRKALPKLPKAEVDAAVWIIWRESGGNINAKNPRSSSHGLSGFLRSTWRNVTSRSGIRHSLQPGPQILALNHYVIRRYGSFTRARRHHERRGWY